LHVTAVLVTGGAGFIGSHLVDRLIAAGQSVRVLDDFSTGKRENLEKIKRIEILTASVTDVDAVREAVQGVDCVFHFAALPSVQRSVEDPARTHAVCATGTLQVLKAAHEAGVRRVIYAASSSAYGDNPATVRKETDPVSPISPYAVAKLAGEHYCRCFSRLYGLETVRLRFFNVFGPRQDPHSSYAGVIPRFIRTMAEDRAPIIYGDGSQSRDFTYVENAVQAALAAALSPHAAGNVYNIGTGVTTTILDLVGHLNDLLGRKIEPFHKPARPGDVRNSQADIWAARRDLDYEPSVSLVDGLRMTVRILSIPERAGMKRGHPAAGLIPPGC
jgi:UDP-glucose 4-epimerase